MEPLNLLFSAIGAIGLLVIQKVWDLFQDRSEKDGEELKSEAKKASEMIHALNLDLRLFEKDLKHLFDEIKKIPTIEKDINGLGEKVRGLEHKLQGGL